MVQDPRNFKFSSDYPMAYFIYKSEQEITVPASSGSVVGRAEITVPHNLPCIPMLVGYWSVNSDFSSTNDLNTFLYGDDYKEISVVADEQNIYIRGGNATSSQIKLYVRLWAYAPPDFNGHLDPVFDDSNYLFNSDNTMLEIYKSGITTRNDRTVYHNLGYVPYCRIWANATIGDHYGIAPVFTTVYRGSGNAYMVDSEKLETGVYTGKEYYHIYTSELQNNNN